MSDKPLTGEWILYLGLNYYFVQPVLERITLLQKRCKESLHLTKFLDLSGLGLVTLDHVDLCPSLHWLIASDNKLQADDGLENQRHLWYLDLGNNEISMLGVLSRYLALGTLILSNNNLKWVDLEKIRHAHIISISLHGNPCLDSDPYYRIHVIDCLPLIWELDGRLVTVTERLHVKQFFIDTELSQHPVRHKMGKSFRTSAIKNIGTEGIVSKQCKYIYSKFPMSETHTKHTDERRLVYLTHMVQEDILRWLEQSETGERRRSIVSNNFLDTLLEQRQKDPERCNMVMLLLVISLEFQLPTALMRSVLNISNLDTIGLVNTMPLFLLPAKHRTQVICVLLNAAKLQRDNNKNHTGGLYPQLFMCLYYTVAQLTRISQTSDAHMYKIEQIPLNSDYRALMAGEVVSLMLNAPRFYSYVTSDNGVISLLECATGNPEAVAKSQELVAESEDIFSMMSVRSAHRRMKTIVTRAILDRLNSVNVSMSEIPIGDRYLSLSDSLPIKPLHSVIWASEFLTNGMCVPRLEPPILYPVKESHKPKPLQPEIGDKVLLGPQVIGEMTLIMDGDISLVKVAAVTLANGGLESRLKSSEEHYTYVDLQALCFAKDIGMWRPIKTQGDTHTIHSVGTNELLAMTQKEALVNNTEKSQPQIRTPITKTLMVYAPNTSQVKGRSQSAVIGGQKPRRSDRRASSAQTPNTNTNFATSRFYLQNDCFQENDLNQNDINDDVTTKSILAPQPDNDMNLTDITNQDDLPEPTSESPVPSMTESNVPLKYTTPLPSRSASPMPQSLHVLRETPRDTGHQGITKEHVNRGSSSEQEASSSSPVQQEHEQEQSQDKDREPCPTVTWSDLGPGSEDPTTIVQPGQKDTDNSTHGQGGVAVSGFEDTFLTTVSGQGEGLGSSSLQDQLGSEVTGADNLADLAGGNHVIFQDPVIATGRPKTSRSTGTFRTSSGSKNKKPPGRPYSAADVKNSDTSARTSPLYNAAGGLRSNLQQLRGDFSKSSNSPLRTRPVTAVWRRSDLVQPPPQRPTSPVSSATANKSCGLKVTSTRTWLGGGRDLYWEDVRRRPKSGHSPGWKEGMPDSMRKCRSKSAHATSTRFQLSTSLDLDVRHHIMGQPHCDDKNVAAMMPDVYPLLQYPSRLASSPASDDSLTIFPPLMRSAPHIGWQA